MQLLAGTWSEHPCCASYIEFARARDPFWEICLRWSAQMPRAKKSAIRGKKTGNQNSPNRAKLEKCCVKHDVLAMAVRMASRDRHIPQEKLLCMTRLVQSFVRPDSVVSKFMPISCPSSLTFAQHLHGTPQSCQQEPHHACTGDSQTQLETALAVRCSRYRQTHKWECSLEQSLS